MNLPRQRYAKAAAIATITVEAGPWIWGIGGLLVLIRQFVAFQAHGMQAATLLSALGQLLEVFILGLLVMGFGFLQRVRARSGDCILSGHYGRGEDAASFTDRDRRRLFHRREA